ncbi:MAG: lamin tail domain-containing protein [Candidatus Methanoplasma sp.]|jgi:hypothetical protein|nr:lamin tail domain-containing protein [Candidatus Methanoplasma sp.]
MRRTIGKIRKSNNGSMPFVAIGVVLLILGSAYGVMISQAKDIEDAADSVVTELGSLDYAIGSTEAAVERGLGEIIFRISTDPEGGSLENRAAMFRKSSADWIGSNYPHADRGVSVSITSFDFVLEAESLKMVSSDAFADGFVPSYLKATGFYTAKFISGSGTSIRTTEIATDGTCALPLVAEQGSLFDLMVSGEGSALSQMMTHQLTAAAQYRVLNGYGALGEYGDRGTASILTKEDVMSAYKNSMDVLELLVFRSSPEGLDIGSGRIDLADRMIAGDGYLDIDISAIYSQALISVLDDLVLKWSDYLYGNVLIEGADFIGDSLMNAWDSLKGFFTGNNEFSAAPYIESIMADNGLNTELYRYLFSGKSASINIAGFSTSVGGNVISVPSLTINADYPQVDLMAWSGISNFKSDYREDTNGIREWLKNVLNSAAVKIGTSKAFGTIRIDIDQGDEEAFMDSVSSAVDSALRGGEAEAERILSGSIDEQKVFDPFYYAIFKVISDNLRNIYGLDSFSEHIKSSASSALRSYLDGKGIGYDSVSLNEAVDSMMNSGGITQAVSDYEISVNDCLKGLSTLAGVPEKQSGVLKKICTSIIAGGIFYMDIMTDIPERIRTLCREAAENTNINAYSGPIELPKTDSFELIGSDDRTYVEKLSLTMKTSPVITIGSPNDNLSDCIHYIGFNDTTGASYATAFSVSLEDSIEYTVKSSGALEHIMGTSDSVFRGLSEVRIQLKIVVGSGWELAGVRDYKPSNTLLEDAWNVLIKLLSPILEPLRKVMSMITDALSILNSALMELSKYVAWVIQKLYDALMVPLELIAGFVEKALSLLFDSVLEAAVNAIQWIVGIDMSKQTVGFSFMGFALTFTTKLSTLASDTKTLLTIAMSYSIGGLYISGSVTIKQKGSGSNKEMMLTGGARVEGNNWSVSADIDPLMRSTPHMISINGHVRGVTFDVLIPDLVQYQRAELSLSDIPALGTVLSNIPLPIPGMKASVDAGVELKYNIPFETGILINEFELNPAGEDKDREWVELYNATKSTVDLSGYTIIAGSNPKTKVYTVTDLTLSPGQKEIVFLPGSFLNNSGSSLLSSGEQIILRSPDGSEVDKTPAKKDSKNDSQTWQRIADGALEWTMAEGTPGTGNCGGLISGEMVRAQVLKILKDSAVKTMGNMKKLTSTGDLSEFLKAAIHDALTSGIEMLSACLVEASVFVSLEINDMSSTVCTGIRIALFIDSGFVEEGLKYLVGEIESILLNIENPYGLRPKEVLTDNLYLGVTLYTGITSPKFLKNSDTYPNVRLGIHINSNISGLCRIVGSDIGSWKVTAGVIIMDCPSALIPSSQKADKMLESDLWLLRATFASA